MVQSQTDAPEKNDLWTAWQLFPLDDNQSCYSKDGGSAYSDGQLWEEIEWALNYYITQCTGNSRRLGIRRVGKWCYSENSTQQKGSLEPPIEQFGDQKSWRNDAVEKTALSRELGLQLSSPGEQERNAVMAIRVGVNMLQFCSVSNSLSHTTLSNKVRGIFF